MGNLQLRIVASTPTTTTTREEKDHLEHATGLRASAHGLTLLLHDLANLHGSVEELCRASVEADGLALVELALAVVGRDALLLARLLQAVPRGERSVYMTISYLEVRGSARVFLFSIPVVCISHHAHLALDGSNLLLRGGLRTTDSQERHD